MRRTASVEEKQRGMNKVAVAIKSGELTRQPCVKCGDVKSHAHHEDYAKPLDVVWLCAAHHSHRHLQIKKASELIRCKVAVASKFDPTDTTHRITESVAWWMLMAAVDKAGSLQRFSESAGISAAFVRQAMRQHTPISQRLAEVIGLRRVTEFERISW